MNHSQLVQDVIEGQENPFMAFLSISEEIKALEKAKGMVSPYARAHFQHNGLKVIFASGYAFYFEGRELKFDTVNSYFNQFEFVQWKGDAIQHYKIEGSFSRWKFGVEKAKGEILVPSDPRREEYINQIVSTGWIAE